MASVYLLLATVLWGIWGYAYKAAVVRSSPLAVQWIYSSAHFVIFILGWVYSRSAWPFRGVSGTVVAWSVTSSVCAIGASMLLLVSLRTRPASIAVASTSAYPLVTMLIAAASRTETLRPSHFLGALLVVGGLVLLEG